MSRSRPAHDPGVRMLLFAIGAVLAVAGILFRIDALVTAAIAVLGLGMVVGIVERRRDARDTDAAVDDDA